MEIVVSILIVVMIIVAIALIIPSQIQKYRARVNYQNETHASQALKIVNVLGELDLVKESPEKHDALLRKSYNAYKANYRKRINRRAELGLAPGFGMSRMMEFRYDDKLKHVKKIRSLEYQEAGQTQVLQVDQPITLNSGIERVLARRRIDE
ncbi:MAG: hypothetical protein LBC43_01535 [Bifidobacteriaceae bacterium]|jgi:hypothetical protein|nr:hypothetical protein [Bifidobacteriaceae bacterium]